MKIDWNLIIAFVIAGAILTLATRFVIEPLSNKIADSLELE